MTNADKIRQMTDEELADFIFDEHYCPPEIRPCRGSEGLNCEECRLKWLQQEAAT